MSKKTEYKFVEETFSLMNQNHLGYIYRGHFTQQITDNILQLTEQNLQIQNSPTKIKKRVFYILVEGLQNITRHQEENTQLNAVDSNGIFVIQRIKDLYFITTGNLIENTQIPHLTKLINKINALSKDELNAYYKDTLNNGYLSDKGGAGLGLIDMARKSGNKLFYRFRELDEKHSYFYLQTVPTIDSSVSNEQEINKTLDNIVYLHKVSNEHNIQLIFNGEFNNDTIQNLGSSLKSQLGEDTSSAKKNNFFHTSVDLLQTVVDNGLKDDNNADNPGIFLICETETKHEFYIGAYTLPSFVEKMTKKLDEINRYSIEELKQAYKDLKKNSDEHNDTWYNFIDIRLRTKGEKIIIEEISSNDEKTFLVGHICLEK